MFKYLKRKIKQQKRHQKVQLVISSLLAGLAGGALTFFTSKKTGQQNRKDFVETSKRMQKDAEKNMDKLSEQIKDSTSKAGKDAEGMMSELKEKVERVKESVKASMNKNGKVIDVEVNKDDNKIKIKKD